MGLRVRPVRNPFARASRGRFASTRCDLSPSGIQLAFFKFLSSYSFNHQIQPIGKLMFYVLVSLSDFKDMNQEGDN